ncbi:nuclear transport factor 2 family protein [Microbulbifer guangxiensis]|uniref:nuclear transport factor 2 family protein n=1 Tax=Microbulbifer guangxiensis TaxID=2904249 RepID=UPI001F291499|nr:nuclear transport factor 2 family protein [Microbulbifer guangxiensis]
MRFFTVIAISLIAILGLPAEAKEQKNLHALLNEFLSSTHQIEMHERFWADDLIYTSSSGQRFGKEKIMEGLRESGNAPVTASYRAEDVDIRLFGDSAVVAFTLIGENTADSQVETSRYFNTGTFVKRDGQWRAVAWQATRIPE